MAQQVEQLIRNQQVAGSNPATSSKKMVTYQNDVAIFLLTDSPEPWVPADYIFGVPAKQYCFVG